MKTIEKRRAEARDVRERLALYLERSGLRSKTLTIVPLTGDASDRKYFRLVAREGPALVLALHPQPFEFATLPFVRVAALLNQMPLPVPAIVAHADDLGVLVLQDLGDVTLQAYLGAVPAREQLGLYRLAVSFLEILQRRGAELASPELPPYQVAFDVEKLLWELDFFTKHFIEGYRGITIPDAERHALREEWEVLAGELAAEPRVLCHRDYHSRNLMVSAGDLYIIDFQDARLGPDTYDLASLLRDSYVDLSEDAVEQLLRHFVALKTESMSADAAAVWTASFGARFDCMSLQRNLKALGTFGYQTAVRANPVYIQYVPRTLRYVKRNLTRHARFGRLHGLLAGLIDELK